MSNNVYLRKDGRWEARLIVGKNDIGKRVYRSFYGSSKEDALQKLTASRRAVLHEYQAHEAVNIITPILSEPARTDLTEWGKYAVLLKVSPVLAGNTVIYMVCVCAVSGCSLMNSSTVMSPPI